MSEEGTRIIGMQQSGRLLPPTARRRRTLIFAKGENANESLPVYQQADTPSGICLFAILGGMDSNNGNATVHGL